MTKINHNIFRIFLLSLLAVIVCAAPAFAASKKDFVVVIDAGHGGKDVGAADNKAQEKDINLEVAKRLEDILKKKKGFKVIMTRDGDKFVSLKDRAEKANKVKADLFISIHTNSVDADNPNRKTVEGSSVYVLGPHRDADNLAVARRENEVISQEKNHEEKYEGFDPSKDESYIIFEMAQKANVSNSIGFAREVAAELAKTAGRKDRGVHQAGFLVLRETAMPAVLVELDFICNPNSARYINSSTGQKKLAQAIANAVVTYRDKMKKSGNKAYADASLEESDNSGGTYVLAGRQKKSDKRATALNSSPSKRNPTTGPRKRRSAAAERASAKRNVETDYIAINTEQTGVVASASESQRRQQTTASQPKKMTAAEKKKAEKAEKERKKKEEKERKKREKEAKKNHVGETRTVGGREVKIGATATSTNPRSLKSSKPAVDNGQTSVNQQISNSFNNGNQTSTYNNSNDNLADEEYAADDAPAVSADEIPASESRSQAATARSRSTSGHTSAKKAEPAQKATAAQKPASSEQTSVKRRDTKTDVVKAAPASQQKAVAKKKEEKKEDKKAKEKQAKADAKKAKEQKKQQELDEQLKKQNAEHNQKLYEAAKQKSIDNYQTSSAPKSLKSKKKKK